MTISLAHTCTCAGFQCNKWKGKKDSNCPGKEEAQCWGRAAGRRGSTSAAGKGLYVNFQDLVGRCRSLEITPDKLSVPVFAAHAPPHLEWSAFFLRCLPALQVQGPVSDHTWEAPPGAATQQPSNRLSPDLGWRGAGLGTAPRNSGKPHSPLQETACQEWSGDGRQLIKIAMRPTCQNLAGQATRPTSRFSCNPARLRCSQLPLPCSAVPQTPTRSLG